MKNLKLSLSLLILAIVPAMSAFTPLPVDDTAALQAHVNAGNYVMPDHQVYHISGTINLTHNLKGGNGDTVYYTNTTGKAFTMNTAGKKLSNFVLIGTSSVATAGSSSGVYINADNDTVDLVKIKNFPGNGILLNNGNYPVITRNNIRATGYTGMFLYPSVKTFGGKVSLDTIDRGMYSPSIVMQAALLIRGQSALVNTAGWTVNNNLFIMPYNTTDPSDVEECFELRFAPRSNIFGNVFRKGTIGVSVVASDYVKVTGNTCDSSKMEGIEFANSSHCYANANILTHQRHYGYLLDGYNPAAPAPSCQYDTLGTLNISGTASHAVHIYKNCSNILLTGGTITTTGSGNAAVYMQGSSNVTVCGVSMVGSGSTAHAIVLDASPGYLTVCGGTISGFTGSSLFAYWHGVGTTDHVYMVGVTAPTTGLGHDLVTATLGTHIQVN